LTFTFLKFVFNSLLFLIFTFVSQIGGLVFLFHKLIFRKNKYIGFLYKLLITFGLYFLATLFILPQIAPNFGREKINNTSQIKPANYLTVLLNRNYVKPKINQLLEKAANQLQEIDTNLQIVYLDASFPFIDGFNLLPHLSHNDGKKLDLSFIYVDAHGNYSNKKKSVSGYGIFEAPESFEMDKVKTCKKLGYNYYDINKYFSFGKKNEAHQFSNLATKRLIEIE